MTIVPLLAPLAAPVPEALRRDVTSSVLPATAEWTNRVALADIELLKVNIGTAVPRDGQGAEAPEPL